MTHAMQNYAKFNPIVPVIIIRRSQILRLPQTNTHVLVLAYVDLDILENLYFQKC